MYVIYLHSSIFNTKFWLLCWFLLGCLALILLSRIGWAGADQRLHQLAQQHPKAPPHQQISTIPVKFWRKQQVHVGCCMFYQYMQQIHWDCWHYPAGRRDMFPAAGGRVPLRLLNRLHVSQRVTRHLLDLCEFREKCCVKSGGLWWKHVSIFGGSKSSALWCILMVVMSISIRLDPHMGSRRNGMRWKLLNHQSVAPGNFLQLGLQPWLETMYDVPRPRQRLQSAQNRIFHLQYLQHLQPIDPDHPDLVEGSCLVFYRHIWWLLETQRSDGIQSAAPFFIAEGSLCFAWWPSRLGCRYSASLFTHCWIRPTTRLASRSLKIVVFRKVRTLLFGHFQRCRSGLAGNAGRSYQLLPTLLLSAFTLHWVGNWIFRV